MCARDLPWQLSPGLVREQDGQNHLSMFPRPGSDLRWPRSEALGVKSEHALPRSAFPLSSALCEVRTQALGPNCEQYQSLSPRPVPLSAILLSSTLLREKETEVTWRKQPHQNKKEVPVPSYSVNDEGFWSWGFSADRRQINNLTSHLV